MRATGTAFVAVLALTAAVAGTARAQSRHPTPAPLTPAAPTTPTATTTTTTTAPAASTEKPTPMWEGECLGALVYVNNKNWRECCLLCSVGDDSASASEKAAAEKANEKLVVNNYFGLGLGRSSGTSAGTGSTAPHGGGGDEAASSSKRDAGARSAGPARNRMGGLASLPSIGGFDSK